MSDLYKAKNRKKEPTSGLPKLNSRYYSSSNVSQKNGFDNKSSDKGTLHYTSSYLKFSYCLQI